MPHPDYPEHAKLAKISDKSQAIGEFLDWCADEKSIRLVDFSNYREDGIPVSFLPLLHEFFQINPVVLEAEKRAILAHQRELNDLADQASA